MLLVGDTDSVQATCRFGGHKNPLALWVHHIGRPRFASVALPGAWTEGDSAVSPSSPTVLAAGPITRSGDMLSIELIQPDSMPAAVRIVWPTAPTITTPARYNEVASTAMKLPNSSRPGDHGCVG
jgi:hypothetical protein